MPIVCDVAMDAAVNSQMNLRHENRCDTALPMDCRECESLKIAFANATIEAVSAEAGLIGCPLEKWQEAQSIHAVAERNKQDALYNLLRHRQTHSR